MCRVLRVQVARTPRLKSDRSPRSLLTPNHLLLHQYPSSNQTTTASFRSNDDTLRHLRVAAVVEAEVEVVAAEVAAQAEVEVEARPLEPKAEVEEGVGGCLRKPSHPS
jgi:flavin-binding protein dodecin